MFHATFTRPDLTTFTRLDELGLEVLGQHLEPRRAVLACRVVDDDRWCRRCGCEGTPRGTVVRRLAHEPFGWRPTILLVTVRRYRCGECGYVWRQDMSRAAEPRAKLSRRAVRWALEGLVVAHLTVARIAEGLAVSWNTANDAVLAEGKRVLINDPRRFGRSEFEPGCVCAVYPSCRGLTPAEPPGEKNRRVLSGRWGKHTVASTQVANGTRRPQCLA